MSENKIGDIFVDRGETVRTFWRPLGGSSDDLLLCSMHRYAYESHPVVREQFENLAASIATNLSRAPGETIAVQNVPPARSTEVRIDRNQFSCWQCTSPQAADARAYLRGFSDGDLAAQLSPRGVPMFCCKVAAVAAQL
jgi:hypothetical protein